MSIDLRALGAGSRAPNRRERGSTRGREGMKEQDCPPLPPTRMYHRADKIDSRGRVSALCFARPRAIDMTRASWTISDDAVTCHKCRSIIAAREGEQHGQG